METKHSKTGIASAVTGIINIIGLISFLLYVNYYLDKTFNPDTIINAVFGSIFAGIIFLIVLAIGFLTGFISLFQKNTKKLFGVLGIILSFISVIIFIILIGMFSIMSHGV
jgi:hypothetical protein